MSSRVDVMSLCTTWELMPDALLSLIKSRIRLLRQLMSGKLPTKPDAFHTFFNTDPAQAERDFYGGYPWYNRAYVLRETGAQLNCAEAGWTILTKPFEQWTKADLPNCKDRKSVAYAFGMALIEYHQSFCKVIEASGLLVDIHVANVYLGLDNSFGGGSTQIKYIRGRKINTKTLEISGGA